MKHVSVSCSHQTFIHGFALLTNYNLSRTVHTLTLTLWFECKIKTKGSHVCHNAQSAALLLSNYLLFYWTSSCTTAEFCTGWVTCTIWMKWVKNNVLCQTRVGCLESAGLDLRLPFSRRHMQKKKTKKRQHIYKNMPAFQNDKHLYFIWAHSCVLAPRTPLRHAGLLSFLKIASV